MNVNKESLVTFLHLKSREMEDKFRSDDLKLLLIKTRMREGGGLVLF